MSNVILNTIPAQDVWAVPVTPVERLKSEGAEVMGATDLLKLLLDMECTDAAQLLEKMPLWRLQRPRVPGLLALGLTPTQALRLSCAMELGRRAHQVPLRAGVAVRCGADAAALCSPRMVHLASEVMVALLLDVRHQLLSHVEVAHGWREGVMVDGRDVFGPALLDRARGIILVHNHPSGDPAPSDMDRKLTKKMAAAGDALNVTLVDHVVVARDGYYSFKGAGALA